VPWIGKRYFEHRILVIGMNFNDWGGLDAHWSMCRWHIGALSKGEHGHQSRFFAYGALTYVTLLRASRESKALPHWDGRAPQDLAYEWNDCAFLQAVKCCPSQAKSKPYQEMFDNCPPLLLKRELEILDPTVVLLLGNSVRDAVRPLLVRDFGLEYDLPGPLERDRFFLNGSQRTVFSCVHPSTPNRKQWKESVKQLEALLDESR